MSWLCIVHLPELAVPLRPFVGLALLSALRGRPLGQHTEETQGRQRDEAHPAGGWYGQTVF